ncbi:MAG: 16S rRNA (cytidine(1402)-2'-O)-methyltransferase [Rhizobiaceae bacterium]|nr:16S rRNA (cytidine(1402)-2'-O)-methyltransferase [Rhizobiaceae bacterium]
MRKQVLAGTGSRTGSTEFRAITQYTIKGSVFTARKPEPALYLAATPIGNLGDITLRVLETLAGADVIACEDTRVTGKLTRHFGIQTKTIAYHEHNADEVGPKIINQVKEGKSVIVVSDAGTPLVSDPGFRLVQAAQEENLKIVPLPGASAPLAALIASGLPNESWTFCGFLPSKQGARKSLLQANSGASSTLIYFESPNRLIKTLEDMISVFGPERMACVGRELTKLHEEIVTDTLGGLSEHFSDKAIKGEIVILIGPPNDEHRIEPENLLRELLQSMPVSKAAAEAASLTGQSKRDLYQLALSIKEGD